REETAGVICNPDMEISGGITVDESLLLPLQPSNKNEKSRATYDRNIFVISKVLYIYIFGASQRAWAIINRGELQLCKDVGKYEQKSMYDDL
ncbi:hypothetical protein, partial [Aeromonas caviae]|uniref:hypothetical protein n=2 Tax=Aeromonas caviae TaxID=648 RepID=UPI002B4A4C6F